MVEAKQRDQWMHTCAIWHPSALIGWTLQAMFGGAESEPPMPMDIYPFKDEVEAVGVSKEKREAARAEAERLKREIQSLQLIGDPYKIKAHMEARHNEQH